MSKQTPLRSYPSLPEGLETRLGAIVLTASTDDEYLLAPECPYPTRLRELLSRLIGGQGRVRLEIPSARAFDVTADEDKFGLVLREVEATIEQMSLLEGSLGNADTGDRIQFVKAKTNLLEKWVMMKERIYSVREMAEFQAIVVRLLDDTMTKDQRMMFIEALRALRSASGAVQRMENAGER